MLRWIKKGVLWVEKHEVILFFILLGECLWNGRALILQLPPSNTVWCLDLYKQHYYECEVKLNIAAVRSSGHMLSKGLVVLLSIYDSGGETYFRKVEPAVKRVRWGERVAVFVFFQLQGYT